MGGHLSRAGVPDVLVEVSGQVRSLNKVLGGGNGAGKPPHQAHAHLRADD